MSRPVSRGGPERIVDLVLGTDRDHHNGDAPVGEKYAGRVLDVAALLEQPDEPIPWRCDRLAADGYLTVLAGKGGEGKSWMALALACGVARGSQVAGIDCRQGRALIFDAENGEKLIGRRLRAAQVGPDLDILPVDAGGLKISEDIGWFRDTIVGHGASLVVFDSLRVLSSGAKESDGDEMEPIVTALKLLARDTGAAIVLIHHRGKSDINQYRGSSVILDQTDMMFSLGRVEGDPELRCRRKITTVKCRIDEEPEARWVEIVADRERGLVTVDEADSYEPDSEPRPRDQIRTRVAGLLTDEPRSGRSIARQAEESEATTRRVLHDLEADGEARKTEAGWVRHQISPRGGDAVTHPPVNGSVEPKTGASRGASPPDAPDAPPPPGRITAEELFDRALAEPGSYEITNGAVS